jgi:hypothetical protein
MENQALAASTVWSSQKFHLFFFVATGPAKERERERERTCFFSVAGDRSGCHICRRGDAGDGGGQPPRGTGTTWATVDAEPERERERERICQRGRGNLPETGGEISERERERGAALEGKWNLISPPTGFQPKQKKIIKYYKPRQLVVWVLWEMSVGIISLIKKWRSSLCCLKEKYLLDKG